MSAAAVADNDRGYVGIDRWRRGLGRDRTEKPTTKFVLGILAQEQVKYATGKGPRKSNAHLADAAGMPLDTFETHYARALASPWIRIVKPRRGAQEVQLVDFANLTKTVGSDGNGQVPEPSDQTETVDATKPANRPFPSDQTGETVGSDGVITSVTDYREGTEVKTAEPRSADATRGTAAGVADVAAFIHAVMPALPDGFGGGYPISPKHPNLREAVAEWRAAGRTDADAAEALATIGKAHRSPAGMIAAHLRQHLAGEAPIPVTSTPRAPVATTAPTPSAGKDKGKPRASTPKPAPAPSAPVDPLASRVGNAIRWPLPKVVAVADVPGWAIHADDHGAHVEWSGPGWVARTGVAAGVEFFTVIGDGWEESRDRCFSREDFSSRARRILRAHDIDPHAPIPATRTGAPS